MSDRTAQLLLVGMLTVCAVALAFLINDGPAAVRARLRKAKAKAEPVVPAAPDPSAADIDEPISDEPISDAEAVNQTCAVDPAGLNWVEVECLRRNYLRMPDEDRYDLDLTFASIVTSEEVSD